MHERDALPVLTPEQVAAATDPAAAVALLATLGAPKRTSYSALAAYDAASGRWTFHAPSQGVFGLRAQIATNVLNVPLDKVRMLTGNVGGSFGMKSSVFPEYVCLFHATRALEIGRAHV